MKEDTMSKMGQEEMSTLVMIGNFAIADLSETVRLIKLSPFLLDEKTINILEKLKVIFEGRPDSIRKVAGKQFFLRDCLKKGLDEAYAEWQANPMKYAEVFSKEQSD